MAIYFSSVVFYGMGKPSRKKREAPAKFVASNSRFPQNHYDSEPAEKMTVLTPVRYLGASVALATFFVYLASLQNAFVTWDDPQYVYENLYIRSFSVEFFKWSFLGFHASNWHPLTWISHAMDYAIWGLNPLGHHLSNNILHTVNTLVVVALVSRLMEAWLKPAAKNRPLALWDDRAILVTAGITGLLFGLHPIHVESVAWVAERKDLLCSLFFLLSVLAYTRYVSVIDSESDQDKGKVRFLKRHYLFALGFFVLALLSKPMAVSLPFVLLILDWYPFNRCQSFKSFRTAFIEKLPFITLSLISSIFAIQAQKAGGAMGMMEFVPLSTRALVAVKSLLAYMWKMLLPLKLLPFYPYPKAVSLLSAEYLLTAILVIAITVACIVLASSQKLWVSVWAYWVVTLVPVIGVVQVGGQAMADRYTYLPSIGPFFIISLGIAQLYIKIKKVRRGNIAIKVACIGVLMIVLVSMTYVTVRQVCIWKNTFSLWSYIIKKEPEGVPLAYYNRSKVLMEMGRLDEAFADCNKAIALNPSYAEAYSNRGAVFDKWQKFDRAIEDFDEAISLNPSYPLAYYNRGLAFGKMGKFDKAIEDFDQAIALNPSDESAYYNRGLAFGKMGKSDKAIENFDQAIALNPSNADAYYSRGLAFGKMGKFDKALDQFNRAVNIDPSYTVVYRNRGDVYLIMGNKDLAASDFQKACDLGDREGCGALQALRRP